MVPYHTMIRKYKIHDSLSWYNYKIHKFMIPYHTIIRNHKFITKK